jgi:methylamine---corrinoid protein Co-methyltransferase
MPVSYLDILERSETGEAVSKDDWDFDHVVMPVRELVEKYALSWDKAVLVPADPDMADRVFQAGFELAVASGVYCIDTGRIIRFSRSELEEGLANMRRELEMGEGKDKRVLFARRIEDPRPPLVWGGNPGVPTPEDIFQPMVMSWMQEPVVDLATCGSLVSIDGYPMRTGEPSEILATRRELRLLREGLRRVGRPGMGLLGAQTAVTEVGDLAAANSEHLRPCDAHLVAMFNELIIDRNNLSRVANSLEYGMRNASLATVMMGGLAGDAPGAALVQCASFILANLVCKADYHLLHPIHIRHVATSSAGVLWMQGIVEQAFSRNAPCIIVSDIYPKSGAGTKELLREVAANAIAITVSGGHLEGVGSADGLVPNGSGLEARLMGEVGRAVARSGLDRAAAQDIVSRLYAGYERVFSMEGGNPGKSFDLVYDMKRLRPIPEWEALYVEAKEELRAMGLRDL